MLKSREEVTEIMERIRSADSPVGMDAVYVHALILDKLRSLEARLSTIERRLESDQVSTSGRVTVLHSS
jgi:hypothetical protein